MEEYKNKNLDPQALEDFLNNKSEFIILNENKTPRQSFKDGKNLNALHMVRSESNLGIFLDFDWVVVDVDDLLSAEKLLELIDYYGWQCNVMKTDRGYHFWFKFSKQMKNGTGLILPVGIKADIKVAGMNSYVVVKRNNSWRKWIRFYKDVDFLPLELTPLKYGYEDLESPVNLKEGGRRNNLFKRIKTLLKNDWNKKAIYNLLVAINKVLFLEELSESEIEHCFEDNSGYLERYENKPEIFSGGKFDLLMFFTYLLNNYKFIRYSGHIYMFDKKESIYKRMSDADLMGFITDLVPGLKKNPLNEILLQLKITRRIENKEPEKDIIALNDCFYNLKTFKKIEINENIFVINKINVDYNIHSKNSPFLNKFLDDITQNNTELKNILLEFVGYCLVFDTNFQKSLLIYGPTASNGKSTFLNFLTYFFGNGNVSHLSFEDLNKRFATSTLLDKMVNIGSDISTDHIKDPSEFKKLVTGDEVQAEFKGKDFFSFKNRSKLIFAANKLPTTSEKSDGYFRRFLIVPFLASFRGERDDKFIEEKLQRRHNATALFFLALEALKRLRQRGRFTESKITTELLSNYAKVNNSVVQYLEGDSEFTRDEVEQGKNINKRWISEVYTYYKEFCSDKGFKSYNLSKFKEEVNLYYENKNIKVISKRMKEQGIFKEFFLVENE